MMKLHEWGLIDRADGPDDDTLETQRQCAWRALRDALQSTPRASHGQLLCNILARLIDEAENPLTLAAAISRGRV